ncbi:MAG TPA: hypothetical protein VHX44_12040 [Planctomycetota bacterium]|nr:hypothetical protein [Planctomycetota bacterium]
MTTPPDSDLLLESLNDELRAQMSALNDLHHPVNTAGPKRIGELERRIADLRATIVSRRRELATPPTA